MTIPIAAISTTNDEPPRLMNGNGTPVSGNSDSMAAMLIMACNDTQVTTPVTFSRLLVTGVVTWVSLQAMINIAAMLSLLPLTGVPLPFISLGGSSLVVLMAAMGIVMNVSKHTVKHQDDNLAARSSRRRGASAGRRTYAET